MKENHSDKCKLCGRKIVIVIKGQDKIEKLCSKCLAQNYPSLKELTTLL